jgi:allantoinase
VDQAKAAGCDLTVEVCYHHALLNESALDVHGVFAKCAPPLRDEARRRALFEALLAGRVDGIGSDHSPAPPDLKIGKDFFTAWGGIMGCQHGLLLLCQLALMMGGEDAFSRCWSLASRAPADRWGLGDRKGSLEVGKDADVILLRRAEAVTVSSEQLLYRHQTSPYCGMPLELSVERVLRRGKALDPRQPGLPAGAGRFLKRQ